MDFMLNYCRVLMVVAMGIAARAAENLPRLVVTQDDTEITNSCIVEIAPGVVIFDRNTNGVIHIAANDVRVRFMGELRGATNGTAWDVLYGIGVRVTGRNVTIENAKVRGFKTGIL